MGLMNKEELLKIRSCVDDPQSTGKFHYGKWGILNGEQRKTIRRLVDYVISCEVVNEELIKENRQLKQALLDIKEYIEKYAWQENKVYEDFVGNYHIDKYRELTQDGIEELLDKVNKALEVEDE